MRSRTVVAAILVSGVAGASFGWSATNLASAEDTVTAADPESSRTEVVRQDLVHTVTLTGVLHHGATTELVSAADGTHTWLPDPGEVIAPGEVLYEVDERPVVLLEGDTPAWRALGPGVADGRDVEQLERALHAEGFGDDLTVDRRWTAYTTRAVQQWQRSRELAPTGRIALGDVVYAPGPILVAEVLGELGGEASGPVVAAADPDQHVELAAGSQDRDLLDEGAAATVVGPDGEHVTATVTSAALTAEDDGRWPVRLTLDTPIDLPFGSAVTVPLTRTLAEQVLTVPVVALVALLEGGHAVEVVEADGEATLTPVTIGANVDGWVEVTGDLDAGDQVVVP